MCTHAPYRIDKTLRSTEKAISLAAYGQKVDAELNSQSHIRSNIKFIGFSIFDVAKWKSNRVSKLNAYKSSMK